MHALIPNGKEFHAATVIGPRPDGNASLRLDSDARYLVNPGSIGQPRDGDPRAAYGIYDLETAQIDMLRVAYPLETTQQKMLKAGLPEPLARRLAAGR